MSESIRPVGPGSHAPEGPGSHAPEGPGSRASPERSEDREQGTRSEAEWLARFVAVLVPARNEAACLPELLDRLSAAGVRRTIVVDNGSTDETAKIAAERGATVVHAEEPGYGRACQAGIRELLGWAQRPGVLAFVDADDFLAPSQLAELVSPIREGRSDQVIGERRSPRGVPGVRPHARLGNALVTSVLRRLYGSSVRDMGPFRAIRVPCLVELDLDDPDYGWYVQMQVRALRRGCRVRGVPVAFRARTLGVSKVSGSVPASVRAGIKILKTLAYEILRSPGRDHHARSARVSAGPRAGAG